MRTFDRIAGVTAVTLVSALIAEAIAAGIFDVIGAASWAHSNVTDMSILRARALAAVQYIDAHSLAYHQPLAI